jgi:hypothetical protein
VLKNEDLLTNRSSLDFRFSKFFFLGLRAERSFPVFLGVGATFLTGENEADNRRRTREAFLTFFVGVTLLSTMLAAPEAALEKTQNKSKL